ncbi:LAQU0S01e09868g1_1 [Lachancea quebecensis]|uniref:LAQU0S01e09868g1_1 n=1 Tax=Lachancea quebecensis TaxID=1654605 RepID=A0A0P1KLJ9_9SACH|nr:LAQU0S01e09868g1_1 [Lachancea quebecensis]
MSDSASESGRSLAEEESEDELIMSAFDASFEKIGRGFPRISFPSIWGARSADQDGKEEVEGDFGRWSRRFQMNTFLNDLQKGLSFSNALTRLQTVKAITEEAISNAINSGDKECNHNSASWGGDDTGKPEVPAGVVPAVKPKNVPAYNDMVIPQGKDPQMLDEHLLKLTELPSDQNNDETALRQRIQHIRSLDLGSAKTAVMMQRLMMGKFVDEPNRASPTPTLEAPQLRDPSEIEKAPTYHNSGVLGCVHYQRNCKLQCHQCLGWYTCRFCHDESPEISGSSHPHSFQRAETRQVLCMRCNHVQTPQKDCENCDEEFALYFCPECKLYDNDETKDIYHCAKCGICRLGLGLGLDFFHCDGCQACLSIELQGNHKCIERATMSSCPICGDFMFTSVKPVVYMSPCGHAIHQHCFDEYTKHSYKCPSCQVSILNMEAQFRVLDKEIEEQPLPAPYCDWICYVSCNDCKAKSTCKYHILGLRCGNCMSYNTSQLKLVKPEEATTHDNSADFDTITQSNSSFDSLNVMRQELLRGQFQREEISPLITVEKGGMLSNIEQYMNGYFHDDAQGTNENSNADHGDYSSQNLFNTAGFFKNNGNEIASQDATVGSSSMARAPSLTDRLRQFINDAPPQLSISDAFQKFIQGSHQGLSSGDEDDCSSQASAR